MSEPLPDLARECGDRGLAAGAGHRGNRRGLRGKESCRGQRQRAARVCDSDERHLASRRGMVADDRHRACGNRGIDETRTVGLAARKGEEEVAGLDHSAIEGNAGHVERRDGGLDSGIIALNVLA
jgi:hypothetical protein